MKKEDLGIRGDERQVTPLDHGMLHVEGKLLKGDPDFLGSV